MDYVILDPDRGSIVSVSECLCLLRPASDARLLTSKPDMRVLLDFAEFSVGAEPEVCGSSIELRMTTGGC